MYNTWYQLCYLRPSTRMKISTCHLRVSKRCYINFRFIYLPDPQKMAGNAAFPVSYLEPCFLLSSPRFDFPRISVDAPLILVFFSQCKLSLSLYLVLMAPINSCSLYIILFFLY